MDNVEAEREMAADVLKEDPLRPRLNDDAADVRPEVAFIGRAEAFTRCRERLTRIARRDDIHASTPASAIEGLEIVPDRSAIQGRIFHPCHESGRCVGFPLDVSHSAVSWLCDVQAEVEPSGSSAEG